MRTVLIAAAVVLAGTSVGASAAVPAPIAAAVADPARPAAERLRDRYRHPAETLAFFGVAPGQTVGEFLPSGGWYTHILMPLLARQGHYVAIVMSAKAEATAKSLVASQPGAARARITQFDPKAATLAPANSLDRLLTFRNIHNLLMAEDGGSDATAQAFFRAAFAALKPGGVLGVVDHRLPADRPEAQERSSGYVKEATVIRLATAAGFRLAGRSPINDNAKDSADWPKGVWTLPPTLTLGATDRDKYLAIGESDRMTLKFVKPR